MSDSGRWPLPSSWQWAQVSQVARVVGGGTPSNAKDETNYTSGGIPWITPADLSGYKGTYISRGARDLSEQGFRSCSARLLPTGSVLLSSRAPVGYCAIAANEISTNQGFKSLVLDSMKVTPEFVRHYFLGAKRYLDSQASGTTFLELSGARTEQLLLPIAPLAEQQRIVSRIDELFSEIDEGERALERVGRLVERYRQSVLKAAVTGGADLASDAWPLKTGSLPSGWSWASIGDIATVSGGLTKNRARAERAMLRPFLRVANVHANRLDLTEVHEIGVSPAELPRVLLEKDDLLVVEGNGSIDQIGRVALWDGSIPGCVHQNHLIKVRCTAAVPSWFVLVWLLSPLGRRHIEQVASSSSGLHTLSISKVQSLPVPVPPASLLPGIRDSFDRMEVATASARAALASERARATALRQSIFKAAFSGQLVPQDPRDEPASALLARLAAQRAEAPAPKLRGRPPRPAAAPARVAAP